jgi:hypothetical protein
VDHGGVLRAGLPRQATKEVSDLGGEVKGSLGLRQEQASRSQLVDGQEAAAARLVPESEGKLPAKAAEDVLAETLVQTDDEMPGVAGRALSGRRAELVVENQPPGDGATNRSRRRSSVVNGEVEPDRLDRCERPFEPG